MPSQDFEKKEQLEFERAAKQLGELLNAQVGVGTEELGSRRRLTIDLGQGLPVTQSTEDKLRNLISRIETEVQKGDWRIHTSNRLFEMGDDGILRLADTSIHLQQIKEVPNGRGGTKLQYGESKDIPVADYLKPYRDELRNIITSAHTETLEQRQKEMQYVTRLQELAGPDVVMETRQSPSGKKRVLVIAIGDDEAADSAINALASLRRRAGLLPSDMPFALDPGKGRILIPTGALLQYDEQNPQRMAFVQLAKVKADFAKIIKEAKDKAAVVPKLRFSDDPAADTTFSLSFVDDEKGNPKKGVDFDIKNGNFSALPPAALKEALRQTEEIREFIKEKFGKDATPMQIRQLAEAANIDGNKDTLTNEELASWMLAKSLERPLISQSGEVSQRFDNNLSANDLLGRESASGRMQDPKLLLEAARQIFSVMREKIGGAKNVAAPDPKPYIEAASKSPNSFIERRTK